MRAPVGPPRRFRFRLLGTAALTFLAALAVGEGGLCQSPAGPALRVWDRPTGPQYAWAVVVGPDGGTTVEAVEFPPGSPTPFRLLLRRFSPADEPLADPSVIQGPGGCCHGGPIAGNAAGEMVLGYSKGQPTVRRYHFPDGPRSLMVNSSGPSFGRALTDVALDGHGDLVAVWQSRGQEPEDRARSGFGLYARLVDAHGVPVGPEIHVNTVRRGDQIFARVSKAAATGAFVVVWETNPTGSGAQVAAQLFAADGTRVKREFRVGSVVSGPWQPHPAVAMAPDGSFVVVWQEPEPGHASTYLILGQRFSAEGTPLGAPFRVSEGLSGIQEFPDVAADPHGNFVVTWNEDQHLGVTMGRLYRADGRPAGKPVALTAGLLQEDGVVAFGWNGTFALTWTELHPVPIAHARRFSASPGEEICVYGEDFECDTGRTGGAPEVRHPFPGEPGDIGLLGDLDGDGRADPCVFRSGSFLCDTAHDSGTEAVVAFGQAGDRPFLADVDGDGRADPCVYRAGHFLCDTAHDGGAAEVDLAFGQPGDIPLLGDIDGDGRADPCVFRAGRFLCDTNRDGPTDVDIAFGQSGDSPLLGDFDGDGRADPCVYAQGVLRCDTAHDGGTAEASLALGFGSPGVVPMLGNLDGL